MQELYKQYVNETYDSDGVIDTFSLNIPDNFNFSYDIVDKMAELEPDKKALVWCNWAGEKRTFTFSDLKYSSDKAANFLRDLGVKKGDMVMLILKRHYDFWIGILALHKIGAVAVPGTALLTTKDLVYRFNAASVKAVICTADGDIANFVDQAQPETPSLKYKIVAHGDRPGWYDFRREIDSASADFTRPTGKDATTARDPMLMYFTSGTTGLPKMVCHNFAYPLAHIVTARHWHCVEPDGLHLTVAETGWGKAVWGKLYGQWIMESAVFVYDFDRFHPKDLLAKMQEYKITTFCAPPTVYRFFIKEGMEGFDLSSLHYATTAGEALNPEVFNRFYQYTGLKVMEAFGQTESAVLIGNFRNMEPRPGSMGKPSPLYDVKLLGEDGNFTKPGDVGEIVVDVSKGMPAGLFMGYYRDPERTKLKCHDGYFHTGDTAWCDEDGYFWYVGRTDDIIKSSGYRIGPFEIESVLMEHPAVLECAITGAPDPVRGQVIKATIVLTHKYEPSDKLAKEIQDYVKKQTAPYKYPRIVEFVPELPKTISGKIRRVEIRKRSQREHALKH